MTIHSTTHLIPLPHPDHGPTVACDLTVFSPAERAGHQHAFESLVCTLARDIVEHDDGFEFRFRGEAGPDLVTRVSSWVTNEQRCCPFFTFDLSMPPPAVGPVTLRLRGSLEAKEVMRAELLARGVVARRAGPEDGSPVRRGAGVGSAGLVAGAGALLCVVGCAAPMLAVGGAMASSVMALAGYAERAGMALAVGGLVMGVVLFVVRSRRPRNVRPAGGCSAGSCGRACG